MKQSLSLPGLLVLLCCIAVLVSGCAFGKFGYANFEDGINIPPGLEGQNKGEIIQMIGVPDSVVTFEGVDYWRYANKKGVYVLLFGKTRAKDMVLVFENNTVTSSRLVDRGSSIGIFAAQGAVAN
ncbi:MAG: hypothetical protein SWH61_14765 [Thermodesulfobacteriota bacterium]|nr:hypothetical protein [Thermodesulfobacteriota bacterium]